MNFCLLTELGVHPKPFLFVRLEVGGVGLKRTNIIFTTFNGSCNTIYVQTVVLYSFVSHNVWHDSAEYQSLGNTQKIITFQAVEKPISNVFPHPQIPRILPSASSRQVNLRVVAIFWATNSFNIKVFIQFNSFEGKCFSSAFFHPL